MALKLRAFAAVGCWLLVLALSASGGYGFGGSRFVFGAGGASAVTAFSSGPCQGTTVTTPSADGTCIDYDSAVLYPNNFIVDANGDKWTFQPFRHQAMDFSQVMKNGVVDPDFNKAGIHLSICSSGQVCLRTSGWYNVTNWPTGTDGPNITGNPQGDLLGTTAIVANSGSPVSLGLGSIIPSAAETITVKMGALPAKGVVYDGATPITSLGQSIPLADVPSLTFLPNSGAHGRDEFWLTAKATTNNATASFPVAFAIRPTPATMTTIASPDPGLLEGYLTVAVNQGASPTAMSIPAPTHVNYAAGSLTIYATSLPSCGTVYLTDGVTPVAYNTSYTVTQLTGMKFAPSGTALGANAGCVFQYSVNDPLTGYAWGIVGLQINQNVVVTTYGSLAVQGNASATALGITVPTVTSGTASTTFTSLPTNGTLSCGGCSAMSNATLGAVTFTPTASTYDKLSSIEYTTTNGTVTTTGSFEIYVGGNPNLVWADPALTCFGNGAGCVSTPLVAGSYNVFPTLTQPVTAGTDIIGVQVQNSNLAQFAGTIDTISGTTAKLHVNQFFQGLLTVGNTIKDEQTPSGVTVTLSSLASGLGLRGSVWNVTCSTTCPSVASNEYMTAHGTMAAGYVTFGQPFADSHVQTTDTLVMVCESGCGAVGTKYYVQKDNPSTHANGSLRWATLTFKLPATVADGAAAEFMIAKCTSGCPSAPGTPAPTSAQLIAGNFTGCPGSGAPACSMNVHLGFTAFSAGGATASSTALGCLTTPDSTSNWLGGGSGALVNEFNVVCSVNGSRLKVEYDIRAYADGTTRVNTIFDNRWMFCGHGGGTCTVSAYNTNAKADITYTPTFSTEDDFAPGPVLHYLYSFWQHPINSVGTIFPNIRYDAPYFMATGATAYYDGSHGVDGDGFFAPGASAYSIKTLVDSGDAPNTLVLPSGGTGPMSNNFVTNSEQGGARPDIAPMPYWNVSWLLTQDPLARLIMMMQSNGQASSPFHFWDENTNRPPDGWATYTTFSFDGAGSGLAANGQPTCGGGTIFCPTSENQSAHMAEGFFLQYLTSGGHFHYMGFVSQAMNGAVSDIPRLSNDTTLTQSMATMQNRVDLKGAGGGSGGGQTRDLAWRNRELGFSAWAPDSEPLKTSLFAALRQAVLGNYQEYIVNNVTFPYNNPAFAGNLESYHGPGPASIETHYVATTYENIYRQHIPMVSDRMRKLQTFYTSVWAPWLSASQGLNPQFSTPYGVQAPNSQGDMRITGFGAQPFGFAPMTSMQQIMDAVGMPLWRNGAAELMRVPSKYQNSSVHANGSFGYVAKAGQAAQISIDANPLTLMAWAKNWNEDDAAAGTWGLMRAYWYPFIVENSHGFAISPKLPDGSYLTDDRFQSDISDSGSGTMTVLANGGAAVHGTGAWTFNGGSGSGCTSVISTGTGTSTINSGTCNTYAVSNCGATTFVDNTGNNVFYGGATCWVQPQYSPFTEAAQTFQFGTNSSGQDAIYGFRLGTDILRIKSTLDGNSFANAAAFTATCSVSGADTVCALGGGNTITVKAVTASLTASVTIY